MKKKTVAITGASRGLGKALALVFAGQGYNLVIHGRIADDLESAKNEILKLGVEVDMVIGDLLSDSTVNKLSEISVQRDVDLFINNAAVGLDGFLPDIADNGIEKVIFTNLISPIILTKKIYAFFLKRGGGTIININSLSGINPQYKRSVYCASKWGLRGFTDSLRMEANANNIHILGVYPSRIKTKPEYSYGMETGKVAQKIFQVCLDLSVSDLVIDERP